MVWFQGYSNKKKLACEKHVYPLSKLQQTNYMDLEVPDDDHFLCE